MKIPKYKRGDKFVGPRKTFFIHHVSDPWIVLRWRDNGQVTVNEQTQTELEIDDVLEKNRAKKVES